MTDYQIMLFQGCCGQRIRSEFLNEYQFHDFSDGFLPVVFVLDRLCVRKTALKNILLLFGKPCVFMRGAIRFILSFYLFRLRQITVSDCCLMSAG